MGIGKKGRIAFEFTRTASSARSAMVSTIAAVRQAIPGAELIEATPDYVGVTDIADLFGVSRQYVQGEIADHIRTFPAPVHEGSAALYHLAKVLVWYQSVRHRSVDRQMFEVAQAAMQVNVEKEYESLAAAD